MLQALQRRRIRVSLERLFCEELCRVEASQLICDAIWLTGFCLDRSFTRKCYQSDHSLFSLYNFYIIYTCLSFREVRDSLTYVNTFSIVTALY